MGVKGKVGKTMKDLEVEREVLFSQGRVLKVFLGGEEEEVVESGGGDKGLAFALSGGKREKKEGRPLTSQQQRLVDTANDLAGGGGVSGLGGGGFLTISELLSQTLRGRNTVDDANKRREIIMKALRGDGAAGRDEGGEMGDFLKRISDRVKSKKRGRGSSPTKDKGRGGKAVVQPVPIFLADGNLANGLKVFQGTLKKTTVLSDTLVGLERELSALARRLAAWDSLNRGFLEFGVGLGGGAVGGGGGKGLIAGYLMLLGKLGKFAGEEINESGLFQKLVGFEGGEKSFLNMLIEEPALGEKLLKTVKRRVDALLSVGADAFSGSTVDILLAMFSSPSSEGLRMDAFKLANELLLRGGGVEGERGRLLTGLTRNVGGG